MLVSLPQFRSKEIIETANTRQYGFVGISTLDDDGSTYVCGFLFLCHPLKQPVRCFDIGTTTDAEQKNETPNI